MTDLQAAVGAAQMDKLPGFCDKRKDNFQRYKAIFGKYPGHFILPEPTPESDPAWFSFIVTLKPNCSFTRDDLTRFLDSRLIETRNIFAGNMTRQPAFLNQPLRLANHLKNTDYVMDHTFFMGTYPGMTTEMMDYIGATLDEFMADKV
jgi:CDP-6-deoxy-D-xylo-4-hexulose-3-dehydrase